MSFKRLIVLAAIGLLTVAANAAQIVIPAAGAGAGAHNSSWHSDVMLHNAAPRPITLSLSFHMGETVIGPKPMTLAAKQTQQVLDIVKTLFALPSGTGAIVVELEDRDTKYLALTSRTYNVVGTDEYGQDIPAIRVEDAATAGHIAVLTNPASSTVGIFRFNFGVYAVDTTTIRWELLRSDGAVVATKEVTYDAGEHQQHNNGVFDRNFLFAEPKRGDSLYARIVSGKAIVYGSAVNPTGDPTYVPANLTREDISINFGVDLDENGSIDIADADNDGVLDRAIDVQTSLFPAHFRVIATSEFGEPVTFEVVSSQADAVFRDTNGTMRVGAAGDLKNKTGEIVIRATSDGTVSILTIPVNFK